ncbi:hypothetical protein Cgig2_022783 [Carnegiea gigantea]|uniref:BURP domain-containing protein n=1 Tax=Carnegiea gigantea TaxID=171969 RepID=A0A9Q1KDQ0_9CARY|nr:hypothetical protein Cgig2_022783 [Carnegiea gigantea]
MKETIIGCEESPVGGEDKYCATSLEDFVDYVISKIGSQVKVLSTTIDKDVITEYTIEKAHKVSSDGNFVCHKARYPHAVFHCHTIRNTDAYVVSLIDANGQKSKAAAVCHRDTSYWNPEHLAFQLLEVEPGSVPICHFVGADDMKHNIYRLVIALPHVRHPKVKMETSLVKITLWLLFCLLLQASIS